jgi:hypothetical protein
VGEGKIDADGNVLERRQGQVELQVRMRTGEGGMREKAEGQIPEVERHRPRMQARQKGPHLRIQARRIVQRDDDEQAAVDPEGRRPQFRRKTNEHLRQTEQGINIPRLKKGQMQKINS